MDVSPVAMEVDNTVAQRRPRRWIIHPGHLAGDTWHVAAALLLDPDVHLVVVTLTSIARVWDDETRFYLRASGRLDELGTPTDQTRWEIASSGGVRDAGDLHARELQHWQYMVALRGLLSQSEWTADWTAPWENRVHVVGGLERWVARDNPYQPARELVERSDVMELIQPGDFVGLTMSSTSVIARCLHQDAVGTVRKLARNLAWCGGEQNAWSWSLGQALERRVHGPLRAQAKGAYRVLYLAMRCADENRQHNTTLEVLAAVLRSVWTYNQTATVPVFVVPVGTRVATGRVLGGRCEKLPLAGDGGWHVNVAEACGKGLDFLGAPFDMFAEMEAIDGQAYPRLASRCLVTEFWRRVAADRRTAGVIGGRSGSLDIAAFMGVRPMLCYDELDQGQADNGNIRLMLTWQLMRITFVGKSGFGGNATLQDIAGFLAGERENVARFGSLSVLARGYKTVYQLTGSGASLAPVSTFGDMKQRAIYGYALLLYLVGVQGGFPDRKAFFGGAGSSDEKEKEEEEEEESRAPLRGPYADPFAETYLACVNEDSEQPIDTFRAWLEQQGLRTGAATTAGNNCLLHTFYQFWRGRDAIPEAAWYGQRRTALGAPADDLLENGLQVLALLDFVNAQTNGNQALRIWTLGDDGQVAAGGVYGNPNQDGSNVLHVLHVGRHFEPLWRA